MPRSDVSHRHKGFRPYVVALGELALAWNDLHSELSFLFALIVTGVSVDPTQHAVWNALKSDRSQRDMLVAAAKSRTEHKLKAEVEVLEDIIWMCGQINSLEDIRNNALHSPLFARRDDNGAVIVRPLVEFGHVRAQKLLKKDILFEFEYCRDCSVLFTNFANWLALHIDIEGLRRPTRPSLPNRGHSNERKLPRPEKPAK